MKVEFETVAEARTAIKKIQVWIDATTALTESTPRRRMVIDPGIVDGNVIAYLHKHPGVTTREIWENVETGLDNPGSMHHIIQRLKKSGDIVQSNEGKRNQRWKLAEGKVVRIRAGEGVIS